MKLNTIRIDFNVAKGKITTATGIVGTWSMNGDVGNLFKITITGNTAIYYSNLKEGATYNIIVVNTTAKNITLTAGKFMTSGTFTPITTSCIISGIYDGTKLWVSSIDDFVEN